MSRPSRSSSAGVSTPGAVLSVAALALAIAYAFAAAGSGGASPAPSAAPSAPVASPDVTPAPVVTPAPSEPAASPSPTQGLDGWQIPLDVALGHDIVVAISDRGGLLVDGTTGKGADGMSVRWGQAIVENLDPHTISVTWAGYPQDETIGLLVKAQDDGVLLRFGQNMPYPNTDAMGADRVLVLTFDEPIAADDVVAEFTTADD
jgi:hypothetical protein